MMRNVGGGEITTCLIFGISGISDIFRHPLLDIVDEGGKAVSRHQAEIMDTTLQHCSAALHWTALESSAVECSIVPNCSSEKPAM